MNAPNIFFVIPGRAFLGASPESITTSLEYGFRARSLSLASRNDSKRVVL
jgi:hypothetical protein